MSRAERLQARLIEARGGWEAQDYSRRVVIPEKRLCIASDVHIPYHDEWLVAQMLDMCKERGTEAIIWLGDVFDMHLFSTWGVTDKSTQFRRELEIARSMMKIVDDMGMKQYWSSGNHEERWLRKNSYEVGIRELASLAGLTELLEAGSLVTSDSPTLDAFGGEWMLTHPASFGRSPLVVPGKLASLYQQNVFCAHAHHFAMGFDPTGKYRVVEGGCLIDTRKMEYVNYRVTTHRFWCPGFWFLEDGEAIGVSGLELSKVGV